MFIEFLIWVIAYYLLFSNGIKINRNNQSFLSNSIFKDPISKNYTKKIRKKNVNSKSISNTLLNEKKWTFPILNVHIDSYNNDKEIRGVENENIDVEKYKSDQEDNDCWDKKINKYKKLLNLEELDEYTILSPKYNINIYNVLEKNYNQKDKNNVILTINNLNYEIGNKKLINNLNLTLNKSECIGLIGNNGCGKSSLLNLIFESSENSNKHVIINNNVKKDNLINIIKSSSPILYVDSLLNKNDFTFFYNFLSYMKKKSLKLSSMPKLIKSISISDFERLNKQNEENYNSELFYYKNDIFYFKQNIHLLGNNNITVFEKILKFYQNTLEKYDILNYIEENISMYKSSDYLKKYKIGEMNEQNKNNLKLKDKKIDKSKISSEEEDFLKSKYFEYVLKLYMNEKEDIFKDINNIKMNLNKYLNILNLKNFLHVKLSDLSNGYIIRVYLLLLLLSKPKLLLIDEINNNMDIFNIFFIMNVFKYALKYTNIGIILASHDFFLISKLCNRILDFNKISGYDIDFSNISLLKKINQNSNYIKDTKINDRSTLVNISEQSGKSYSNLTFFKGNYTQYLNNMKILFNNRKKKKEDLKKIIDQLNASILKIKKNNKKEFLKSSLKKKEEELSLYQNIYNTFFNVTLNYQHMYYNLIYSKKNEKRGENKYMGFSSKDNKQNQSIIFRENDQNNIRKIQDNQNCKIGEDQLYDYHNENSSFEKEKCQYFEVPNTKCKSEEKEVPTIIDEMDEKKFVYNQLDDVDREMNKNILIDMCKKIKNNELIKTGELYSTQNVTLYEFQDFSLYYLDNKNYDNEYSGIKKKERKKYIFKDLNLNINSNENVLLLGKNGIGKSTLFKILTNKYSFIMNNNNESKNINNKKSMYVYGDSNICNSYDEAEENDTSFNCEIDKNIRFEGNINCSFNNVLLTYFEQNMIKKLNLDIDDYFKYLIEKVKYQPINFLENPDFDNTPFGQDVFFYYILNKTKPDYNDNSNVNIDDKIKSLLKIFYIDSETSITEKSGGEKVRILFLSLFLKKSNLLLLDEINNNLDIYLKNLLLNFLNYIYQGSYILTTHDFYIINNLNNIHKIIYIFDYQNVFTFYNVNDFVKNFYSFILNSFSAFKNVGTNDFGNNNKEEMDTNYATCHSHNSQIKNNMEKMNYSNELEVNNTLDINTLINNFNKIEKKSEELNRENYGKELYDSYDFKILEFLKNQLKKDKSERKSFEEINPLEEEIFEKKKINKKNFGGKGLSGKVKIKNWKRWKK
ncbi:ABC transporter F family member 1, putative [Plasmodium berghei]|uniref:ABC transporter F family member 1, putative n=2 Tax=Plasmodium berghei TaxID=5821 RepID=A0A509ASN7_PLABA|nr:ABC transporter F family member 1, putative [Plasmodium berghei ANKA]CXJ17154.1 ABC transporter F family member 1, putative [Plasmodium berghei]SCM26356.1 ABC transporter F family member 1, putative [Plasmodium berghei]SCN28412.1 ABC transporter F family member 1, putative [Plasmodium berghei]SCO62605.1 ABC transporter F family member 1, putative [Plasmodium berghei]SCO64164.1 ABC transporter F family member 1, putative [Plasmodium berghei]|eukprot:XP_034424060.1 ABC transporter F family member 1, putative [Plasmodium berghei ANKA]